MIEESVESSGSDVKVYTWEGTNENKMRHSRLVSMMMIPFFFKKKKKKKKKKTRKKETSLAWARETH